MTARALFLLQRICLVLLCSCGFLFAAHAQQDRTTPEQPDDVLRISSDLAQTDVMVFDKKGRFVDNLTRDQFELKIDGKTKPISFFEYLQAGSRNEDSQLAAARGVARPSTAGQIPGSVMPLDRGRVVLFFVDDQHLAIDSVQRVQALLEQFMANDFGQNDKASISSGSGQLGFLEQLTGDKAVLLTAISRLRPQSAAMRDSERPPMSDVQALAIARYDSDVTDFFVDRFMADNPGFPRPSATEMVRRRSQMLLQQASSVTKNSLQSLYNLIREAGELPERKLLFFISDGFLIDDQTSNISVILRRITDAAARAGVVVYTLDARGLTTGIDMTMDSGVDPANRLARTSANEITVTQAPLRQISTDTGGRALLNTNALSTAASVALKETSAYYVLAWRPDTEQEDNKFRRIDVSIIGHPDLTVRVRRGFIEKDSKTGSIAKSKDSGKSAKEPTTTEVLRDAIQARVPLSGLPTTLFVSFANDKELGSYVTISMEVDQDALAYMPKGGKQSALVNLAGVVFDDKGKSAASFQSQLTVNAPAAGSSPNQTNVAFNHQTKLKPGLYQVRVAATDNQSGRSGSAVQWIEVPDLERKRLSLSSITVGELKAETTEPKPEPGASENVFLSISRRFARASNLRFFTFIYNAAQKAGVTESPDVVIQVQIFRDNQPVFTTALSKVNTEGIIDLTRLPFAADIPLSSIPTGHYRLQVTVIDRIAKASATQHVSFEVG